MQTYFYRKCYYHRYSQTINALHTEEGKYHLYTISPHETGQVFRSQGSTGENNAPIIFVLPPIEQCMGMRFSFVCGPTTEMFVFCHTGKNTGGPYYDEWSSHDQLGLSAYLTEDFILSPDMDKCLHWHTSHGDPGSVVTIEATKPRIGDGHTDKKGGHWLITERQGGWQSKSPPNWLAETSFDWYQMDDRFPNYGGNPYNESNRSNVAGVTFTGIINKPVNRFVPYFHQKHINIEHDTTLTNGSDVLDYSRWRGAMLGNNVGIGANPTGNADRDAIIQFGQLWKGNHFRYQLTWGWPGSDADFDDQNSTNWFAWIRGMLDTLDSKREWFETAGVKIVLDMHTPPGGRYYYDTDGRYVHRIFVDPVFQQHHIDFWQETAQRYKDDTLFLAFDIFNEPQETYTTVSGRNWNQQWSAVASGIHAIDPDRKVVVSCNEGGQPFGMRDLVDDTTLDHIVFTAHVYQPVTMTHQAIFGNGSGVNYPGLSREPGVAREYWDHTDVYRNLRDIRDFKVRARPDREIYIGEFSFTRYGPPDGAVRWLQDNIEQFENEGWHWAYHAYRESDVWSLELPGGPENSGINQANSDWVVTERQLLLRSYYQRNVWDDRSGFMITNSGAGSDVVVTLPPATKVGSRYSFTNTTQSGKFLRIRPQGTDNLMARSDVGSQFYVNELSTDQYYANTRVDCIEEGLWSTAHEVGDWEAVLYQPKERTTVYHVPGDPIDAVSSFSITADMDGATFTSSGNFTTLTFHLPPAQLGMDFSFVNLSISRDGLQGFQDDVGHAWPIITEPYPGDVINIAGSVADKANVSTSGHNWAYRLICTKPNTWETMQNFGVLASEDL